MRQNLRNVVQAISIAAVAPYTYLTGDDGDKFTKYPGDATPPILPTRQLTEDNMVGDGRAYKKQGKPYMFDPRNIPYSGALNSTMGVRVLRDWLGGTITTTVNTTPGTVDNLIRQKAPGSAPRTSNIIRILGGESLLHGDVFVQTIEIAQQGMAEPRITGSMSNSGHYKKVSDTMIDPADITASLMTYLKYHGNKTRLTFSDGTTSYDFANEHRLIDVSFSGNQNVIVENLPGDPFQDTSKQCQGAYAGSVYIDIQSAQITAKVYMDENFTNFDAWVANRKLTSVSLLFASCEIVGAGATHFAEIEIKIPIAQFNLAPDQQGNFSAYSFTIEAIEGDPTTGNLVQARIRQVGNVDPA